MLVTRLGSLLAVTTLALSIASCGEDAETTAPTGETPYVAPPASTIVEEGAVTIRREVFLVPGFSPPKNPTAAAFAETPAEANFVRVVRYRVESDPPKPARAIAVLMPGFLGGAASYDAMARALVRRSTDDSAFEAWAIDRRSNLLEDHHGLDVAEARRDPEIAKGYYFEEEPVEGRVFEGFVEHANVAYMSEWGLVTTIEDLDRVIDVVEPSAQKSRVVLVGHSLGASIVEEYAAWDFKGARGFDKLAGLVLIDGVSRAEGDAQNPLTKESYAAGPDSGITGFSAPGLDAIRSTTRFIALPFLGLRVYPIAATAGMRSQWLPAEIAADPYRDNAFSTLLSLPIVPKMTNRAAMGLAFDSASNGVTFAAVSCGEATGGPLESYESLLGSTLMHPSDASATYDWIDFDKTSPVEHTSLRDIARSWYEGPGLDFAEWYFPARLSLDVPAASTLVQGPGDFAYDEHGMRAMHGASMDLPILAAAAGLVATTSAFDKLAALVDSVPIGEGRPLAGAPRSDSDAFKRVDISSLTHIDPLTGTDGGSATVTGWYDTVSAWMTTNTPAGGVVVEKR